MGNGVLALPIYVVVTNEKRGNFASQMPNAFVHVDCEEPNLKLSRRT